MIVGVEQGTYTVSAGTRQFTVSGLSFEPTKEGVLMVLNITQDKIYYAAAQSYTKSLTITQEGSSDSYVFEYSTIFPVLGANDILHIQLQEKQSNYATIIDDYSSANIVYAGDAMIGSVGTESVWRIQKINKATGIIITWADGNDSFDNVWNDRLLLNYS